MVPPEPERNHKTWREMEHARKGSLIFIYTHGANTRQARSVILFSEEAKADNAAKSA